MKNNKNRNRRIGPILLLMLVALTVVFTSTRKTSQNSAHDSSESDLETTVAIASEQPALPIIPMSRRAADEPAYVERQILVEFSDDIDERQKHELVARLGANIKQQFPHSRNLALLELPVGFSVERAQQDFAGLDDVLHAEPNFIFHIEVLPDDPLFPEQWGLHNIEIGSVNKDIDAPAAWDISVGSNDVVIGVIDTGINHQHADLVDNLWVNAGETPDNGLDDDNNGYVDDIYGIDTVNRDSDPLDDEGHGTHVSGTIAAKGNDGYGVAGVVWDAKIASCKAFDINGSATTAGLIECFDYFLSLKTRGVEIFVTNNSWGGYSFSALLYAAIARHQALGIMTVAAAGNERTNTDSVPHYPSSYDHLLTVSVAAHGRNGQIAEFSNFGLTTVDVAAPGVSILSTYIESTHAYLSGTSMAAPHITGMLALMSANSPLLTPAELKAELLRLAVPESTLTSRVLSRGRARLDLPFVDTDGDGLPDQWEVENGLDPLDSADGAADGDSDGLINRQEFAARTDPNNSDTDADGLSDGDEIALHGTDPLRSDTDSDGLSDGDEINVHLSDPALVDTDSDGLDDWQEVNVYGTNPTSADSDGDGLSDSFEVDNLLDPNDASDALADPDGDGLNNTEEFVIGTNPFLADTDEDGLIDGDEVNVHITDPLDPDSDGDGMADGWEIQFGLDALSASDANEDPDLDGFSNLSEFRKGTNPLDRNSFPVIAPWTTFQGNAARTGHVPIEPHVADFTARFRVQRDLRSIWNEVVATGSHLVMTGFGIVGRDSGNAIRSVSLLDGETEWKYLFVDSFGITRPAISDGSAFVVNNTGGSASLYRFEIETGEIEYVSPIPSSDRIHAIVADESGLLLTSKASIISVNADTGAIEWAADVVDSGNVTTSQPRVASFGGQVARQYGNTLVVLDRQTGQELVNQSVLGCSGTSFSSTMFDASGNLFGMTEYCVFRFDVNSQTADWVLTGQGRFDEVDPAIDDRALYFAQNDNLVAIDPASGSELWRWADPDLDRVRENIVSTLNLVFLGDSQGIHAFDPATQTAIRIGGEFGRISAVDESTLLFTTGNEISIVNTEGDSDGDGLPNWWERHHKLDYLDAGNAATDLDGDGLTDLEEFSYSTNPNLGDSDRDGLSDWAELFTHSTDPGNADSDDDGLSDGAEINTHSTNPNRSDSDRDGFSDGDEVFDHASDPNDREHYPTLVSSHLEDFENGFPNNWRSGVFAHAGATVEASPSDPLTNSLEFEPVASGGEIAAVEWTALFDAGDLTFEIYRGTGDVWISVDGEGRLPTNLSEVNGWARQRIGLTRGLHTIRWIFVPHGGAVPTQGNTAWLDNVNFEVPVSLGSRMDSIVTASGPKIREYDIANTEYREPFSNHLSLPGYAGIAVTPLHDYAFIQLPFLTLLNVETGQFVKTRVADWDESVLPALGGIGITATDDYILATSGSGIQRFDLQGNWIDKVLSNSAYVDISLGRDGNLYALVDRFIVHVIDQTSFQVASIVLLNGGNAASIAADENGVIYTGDRDGNVSRYDGSGVLIESKTIWPTVQSRAVDVQLSSDGLLYLGMDEGNVVVLEKNSFDEVNTLDGVGLGPPAYVSPPDIRGPDSDGDGLPDWWEKGQKLDWRNPLDAVLDPDSDGLNNLEEYQNSTLIIGSDSDQDGLQDSDEVNVHATNPARLDTDFDRLNDSDEINLHGTSPLIRDSDGDGLKDGDEILDFASNPLLADTDGDGLPDGWEAENGLDPVNSADALFDQDADGLSNVDEYLAGTRIDNPDSDFDGLLDGDEVNTHATNPVNGDTDSDALPDAWEISNGFDPLVAMVDGADQDGDGFTDRHEFFLGTNPFDATTVVRRYDWQSYQGDFRHTGFMPVITDASSFQPLWDVDVVANDSVRLNQASSSNGQVFVTSGNGAVSQRLLALDLFSGATQWQRDFGQVFHVSQPAIQDGTASVQTSSVAGSYHWSIDSTTGVVSARSLIGASDEILAAPTPYMGDLFSLHTSGTVASVENIDGAVNWQIDPQQDSNLSPLIIRDYVVAYSAGVNRSLRGYNRLLGSAEFEIDAPTIVWRDFNPKAGITPIDVGSDHVAIIDEPALVVFDIITQMPRFQIDRGFSGQPAYLGRTIYAINGGALVAISSSHGGERFRWRAGLPLEGNIVISLDHVFVSTATTTYAIDLATGSDVWSFPRGGALSMSSSGVLLISGTDGVISAISTVEDSDGDMMPDYWETQHGHAPNSGGDASDDLDNDGLTALEEFVGNTLPDVDDSDGDGVVDGDERLFFGSDPWTPDTDSDGLSDLDEVTSGTDPLLVDTDTDGLTDAEEVQLWSTNPVLEDTDSDGVADGWELRRGGDPVNASILPAPISQFTYSFETPAIRGSWSKGINADAGWRITSSITDDGVHSLQSDMLLAGQTAAIDWADDFEWTKLWFDLFEPRPLGGDFSVFVDGVEVQPQVSTSNTSVLGVEIPAGRHIVRFEFTAARDPSDWPVGHLFIDSLNIDLMDKDGDLMADDWETLFGLNPQDPSDDVGDLDGDGVINLDEFLLGLEPDRADTDRDGMPDGWELDNGFDPLVEDGNVDADTDGLSNADEYRFGADPHNPDTDGDGLPDGWEVTWRTDLLLADGGSDPDSDALDNLGEFSAGTDPFVPDSDNDQMPDGWEVSTGLDPLNSADGGLDPDADALTNRSEFIAGTLPNNRDTDSDQMLDGWEVQNRLDPLVNDAALDPDSDGFTNLQEFLAGTEPNNPFSFPVTPAPPGGGGGGGGGSAAWLLLMLAWPVYRRRRARLNVASCD